MNARIMWGVLLGMSAWAPAASANFIGIDILTQSYWAEVTMEGFGSDAGVGNAFLQEEYAPGEVATVSATSTNDRIDVYLDTSPISCCGPYMTAEATTELTFRPYGTELSLDVYLNDANAWGSFTITDLDTNVLVFEGLDYASYYPPLTVDPTHMYRLSAYAGTSGGTGERESLTWSLESTVIAPPEPGTLVLVLCGMISVLTRSRKLA